MTLHRSLPRAGAAAALIALGLAFAPAQATRWTEAAQPPGSVRFIVHEMGVPVDGNFQRFAAKFSLDPTQPTQARAQLDIELASIDTGNADANAEVVGKNWFDVRNHPSASFRSSSVRVLGPNRYEVRGTLQIKGRTKEVAIPVEFHPQPAGGSFEGAFEIHRADFAIGEGEWADFGTVANEIQVQFRFAAAAARN